jgi:hypothetical protein
VSGELPIVACSLDFAGSREQGERYRALGQHLRRLTRSEGAMTVRFDRDVDPGLVAEIIAVERECCPFFTLDYNAARSELAITVEDARLDPALDALRSALGGGTEARAGASGPPRLGARRLRTRGRGR